MKFENHVNLGIEAIKVERLSNLLLEAKEESHIGELLRKAEWKLMQLEDLSFGFELIQGQLDAMDKDVEMASRDQKYVNNLIHQLRLTILDAMNKLTPLPAT